MGRGDSVLFSEHKKGEEGTAHGSCGIAHPSLCRCGQLEKNLSPRVVVAHEKEKFSLRESMISAGHEAIRCVLHLSVKNLHFRNLDGCSVCFVLA